MKSPASVRPAQASSIILFTLLVGLVSPMLYAAKPESTNPQPSQQIEKREKVKEAVAASNKPKKVKERKQPRKVKQIQPPGPGLFLKKPPKKQ